MNISFRILFVISVGLTACGCSPFASDNETLTLEDKELVPQASIPSVFASTASASDLQNNTVGRGPIQSQSPTPFPTPIQYATPLVTATPNPIVISTPIPFPTPLPTATPKIPVVSLDRTPSSDCPTEIVYKTGGQPRVYSDSISQWMEYAFYKVGKWPVNPLIPAWARGWGVNFGSTVSDSIYFQTVDLRKCVAQISDFSLEFSLNSISADASNDGIGLLVFPEVSKISTPLAQPQSRIPTAVPELALHYETIRNRNEIKIVGSQTSNGLLNAFKSVGVLDFYVQDDTQVNQIKLILK